MGGGYGMDPDQLDLMQLQKKKELAQQMVMGAKPAATRAGGILGVITALLAGRQMSQADEGIKSAMDRQNQRRMGDMDNFANLLTMRPQGPQAQTNPVANDDEGNPMPAAPMTLGEAPDAFQARKMALAKSMISSPNPQVAQFAMQSLMPQKADLSAFSKVDAKDYTAESVRKFMTSQNPADLVPRDKMEIAPNGMPVNPFAMDTKTNYGKVTPTNLGGVEALLNPAGQTVGALPRSQSPESVASNAVAIRGQNMTDARARDLNDNTRMSATQKGETDLRKEFEGLPEVKNYKMAYPAFASVKDAATRNTPQADINLVYGIAKIFDPTSVVREGEYATVANSPNIPDRIKGMVQYVQGGGKLAPEVKAKFVKEAESRVKSYEAEVNKAKSSYGGMVKQYGYNPDNVFQGMGNMANSGGWSIQRVN